jgi:hypothetical protein
MRTDGIWFKDESGRTLLLRGANLGGSSKVPTRPNGATYLREGFFDHRDVSFVGRPFPLDEADEHFGRLRAWGLTFLRLLTTWEAIEHAGPGQYDDEYLAYLRAIVQKAAEYDIQCFVDPHQDVWSRWTGGDGAPGWTFDLIGMDITRLDATGAAITHQMHGDPFPRMIWPSNYARLGAATMFTLFFGGNDFAPATTVDGEPIQEYLQRHYINSIVQVARRLHDLPNVVGYDTLNEPGSGFIGLADLHTPDPPVFVGPIPTPFQTMLLSAGYPQEVVVWEATLQGPRQIGTTQLNPNALSVWREGYQCIWKQNGVWTDEGGTPRVLRPHHFIRETGGTIDFPSQYLKPFALRFTEAIRAVHPEAVIFLEGVPGRGHPHWGVGDPPNVANAAHWYDIRTLFTKHYDHDITQDFSTGAQITGADAVKQAFVAQLGRAKQAGIEEMGGIPTLMGEFGIPFDLDEKAAYLSGDFSTHVAALDAYIDAMDVNLLNYTIWNYTPDNTNERGDLWNDEDLSIFSRDQQRDPTDINSGGRALSGFVRPYARKTAGTPQQMRWDLATRTFEFTWLPDPSITASTEIFVPNVHYPDGYRVELSAGSYRQELEHFRLLVDTLDQSGPVTLRLRPA